MSEPVHVSMLVRQATAGVVLRGLIYEAGASIQRIQEDGFVGVLISPLNPQKEQGRALLYLLTGEEPDHDTRNY